MGARNVDLDSIAGWVRFTLPNPSKLDFHQLESTFASANYELHTIEVVVDAKHRRGSAGNQIVVQATGEEFAFSGAEAWTGSRRIHVMAEGWKEFEPKLVWVKPSSFGYQDADTGK